jgi:hypothetical protein
MRKVRASLPFRIFRARHDNAVWIWQQKRVKRAVELAFSRRVPTRLDDALRLSGDWPIADDPRPVVFAACDEGYFYRFGRHLALSSASRSPDTRVHLHVYEPSPSLLEDCAALRTRCGNRLTISHEGLERNPYPEPNAFYYAAGRFAVASRMRRTISAPILMIDADGLVAQDLSAGFAELAGTEAAFVLQPENAALYRKILASAIYLGTNGERTIDFFSRLADGIGAALAQGGRYHVDQIGIHYALEWCRRHHSGPTIEDLDLRWTDYRFAIESLIWSTKGARKGRYEELLQQIEG